MTTESVGEIRDIRTGRIVVDQLALFPKMFDRSRFLLEVSLDWTKGTLGWRITGWESHDGGVLTRQELADRPLSAWSDELSYACQEFGLAVQDQANTNRTYF